MNLAEVRAQVTNLLNRSDCTSDLTDSFVLQAMEDIQAQLRLPSMERMCMWTVTGEPLWSAEVPDDLLELIDLLVVPSIGDPTQTFSLEKRTYRQLLALGATAVPAYYARLQAEWHFRAPIPVGYSLQAVYFGEFSDLDAGDASENEVMDSSPFMVVYGALALAGDYFDHPKTDSWRDLYTSRLAKAAQQAADVEFSGGALAVSPAYGEGGW